MLLALDVGNTQVSVGVFRKEQLLATWRLATERHRTADEYGTKLLDCFHYATLDATEVRGAILASVVPPLDPVFYEVCLRYFKRKPLVVNASLAVGIKNLYHHPQEVGADRLVNAVAAYSLLGGPCIVVDFGTATTFDCITKHGEYAGGAIAPGLLMAAEALAERTAKLPRVELAKPAHAIGKTTAESLQAGIFFGFQGLVEGVLQRLRRELGGNPKVVATGGLASLMVTEGRVGGRGMRVKVLPHLTLEGLRIIWERHQPG